MKMGFLDRIKHFFGLDKKKSKEEKKKEIWQAGTSPDQIEQLPERFQKSYYKMKGRLDKLEDTVREQKDTIKELREGKREEEKEKAYEQEQEIEKKKERNRIPFFFSNNGKSKPIFLVSALDNKEFFEDNEGTEWKIWKGILYERTKHGTGFSFLLTRSESDEIIRLPKNPIPMSYFPHIFDTDSLITDMRTGQVPIYIDKEGNYVPPQRQVSEEDVKEGKKKMQKGMQLNNTKKKVEKINEYIEKLGDKLEDTSDEERKEEIREKMEKGEKLLEQEKEKLNKLKEESSQDYADTAKMVNLDMNSILEDTAPEIRAAFIDLYNKYTMAKQREKKAAIRARKLLLDKHDAEVSATVSQNAEENLMSQVSQQGEQMNKMMSKYSNMVNQNRRARLMASAAEGEVEDLWDVIEDQSERIKEKGKSDREKAKEELKEDTEYVLGTKQNSPPIPKKKEEG